MSFAKCIKDTLNPFEKWTFFLKSWGRKILYSPLIEEKQLLKRVYGYGEKK